MTTHYKKTLDKSRDYGESRPPENGVFYWQDGYPFNHEGKIVESQLTPQQRETLAKKAPAAHPPKPPKPHGGDGAVHPDEPESGAEEPADGLNLTAWLKGEAEYAFPDVQKAVKERYKVWKTGKRDLLMFLVDDQKLVPVAELSAEFKSMVG